MEVGAITVFPGGCVVVVVVLAVVVVADAAVVGEDDEARKVALSEKPIAEVLRLPQARLRRPTGLCVLVGDALAEAYDAKVGDAPSTIPRNPGLGAELLENQLGTSTELRPCTEEMVLRRASGDGDGDGDEDIMGTGDAEGAQ